jgi:hypothetical protein
MLSVTQEQSIHNPSNPGYGSTHICNKTVDKAKVILLNRHILPSRGVRGMLFVLWTNDKNIGLVMPTSVVSR